MFCTTVVAVVEAEAATDCVDPELVVATVLTAVVAVVFVAAFVTAVVIVSLETLLPAPASAAFWIAVVLGATAVVELAFSVVAVSTAAATTAWTTAVG